jgi:hypothetical protein
MSYARDFNKDPLNHRYIDEQNCIEYVFVGFPGKISQAQKKKLIKKCGRPRKYKPSLIDTKHAVIDFGPPSWIIQVIGFPKHEKS